MEELDLQIEEAHQKQAKIRSKGPASRLRVVMLSFSPKERTITTRENNSNNNRSGNSKEPKVILASDNGAMSLEF